MGAGELSIAVADAGPLIHLTEIGCLRLLCVFDILNIPDEVWFETVEQGRVSQSDLIGLGGVQRHTLSDPEVVQFVHRNSLEDLQKGECECLCLCKQVDVSVLLTDDLAVREVAKRLHLTPVGSLGIVVRAYRLGRISLIDAERHISNLYDVSSLFVTRAIVELASEQLRKRPG